MPFADNMGVRLHWQAEGAGTPVLLVMGHRYSAAMWYPVLPALSARHRVIWFDNRGTGESDTTRKPSLGDLADDAIAVMDAAGVASAHVFGVSMGGVIVQDLALRHRERVRSLIVGCSGILDAGKPRMPAIMRTLYYLPPWALRLLMRRGGDDHGYGSAAPLDKVAHDQEVLKHDRFTVPGVVAQAAAIAGYATSREAISDLTMPALVLHGDEDKTVPFAWGEELAQALPNGRFVRIEGAGHNFIVAATEQTNAAVLDFLKGVDASPT